MIKFEQVLEHELAQRLVCFPFKDLYFLTHEDLSHQVISPDRVKPLAFVHSPSCRSHSIKLSTNAAIIFYQGSQIGMCHFRNACTPVSTNVGLGQRIPTCMKGIDDKDHFGNSRVLRCILLLIGLYCGGSKVGHV